MVAQASRIVPIAVATNGFIDQLGNHGFTSPESALCIATHGWICVSAPVSEGGISRGFRCPEGTRWEPVLSECVSVGGEELESAEIIEFQAPAVAVGLRLSRADGYARLAATMARTMRLRRKK